MKKVTFEDLSNWCKIGVGVGILQFILFLVGFVWGITEALY